ncbi:GTP-binding protein YPTC1 [Pelomyxa schiedti]|nr:GTP-binding protein YPTC1 [Pelomyxa schiedti]KAH3746226.1 GTP-binding protein YPTC1 [Pelomyxa schiedti]
MAAVKDYDYIVKLLLVGDSGVGKSCLLMRFVDDEFTPCYISTIGVDFKIRTVQLESKILKTQIWDTAGEERFRTITTAYYRNCNGMIVVYDITNSTSFDNIGHWLGEIERNCSTAPLRILLGNKLDLADPSRQVEYSRAKKFADEHGIKFWETSSKDSTNVEEAIMSLLTDVKRIKEAEESESQTRTTAASTKSSTSGVSLIGGKTDPSSPSHHSCC